MAHLQNAKIGPPSSMVANEVKYAEIGQRSSTVINAVIYDRTKLPDLNH